MTVTLLLAFALASPQARDLPRPVTGTAELAGTVTLEGTANAPVRRATVRLQVSGDPLSVRETMTDEKGRFRFTGLPAGNVTLQASKPAHVTTYFGAKRPGSTVGVPIAIVDGASIDNVTLRMPPGAVIAGTVTGPDGQRLRGVSVRLQRVTTNARGERVVTPLPMIGMPGSTDDRGMYRLFGLPAGDYLVHALPRVQGPALVANQPLRQTTAEELAWAERAIAAGPRAPATPAPAAPEAAPPRERTVTYASVYYPGSPDPAGAAVVSVAAGEERPGVDIPVTLIATARIDGTVLESTGQPARGYTVMVIPKGRGATPDIEREIALMGVGLAAGPGAARVNADGTFSIRGVPPGDYTLVARRGYGPGGATQPDPQWAMSDVSVSGQDVEGISVTLAPGLTVGGRVAFASSTGASPPRVTVRLTPAESGTTGSTATGVVDVSGRLTFAGVMPGAYRLAATLPAGGRSPWMLASAMLDGRDVADVPFLVAPGGDVSGLVVTFADTSAELSGTLYDAAGRPTSDLSILVFAADPARRFRGSRGLRAPVRPNHEGRFAVTGLPAGEYFLAALSVVDSNDWMDPEFLEQAAASAIRIPIAPGEKKVQDVRLK